MINTNVRAVQDDIHAVLSTSLGPAERLVLSATTSTPKIHIPSSISQYRSSRPSTASLIEDRKIILPASRSVSSSSAGSLSKETLHMRSEQSRFSSLQSSSVLPSPGTFANQDINSFSNLAGIDLTNMSDSKQGSYQTLHKLQDIGNAMSEDLGSHEDSPDWSTFIKAYAAGLWNPHHTPNQPRITLATVPKSVSVSTSSSSQLSGRTLTGQLETRGQESGGEINIKNDRGSEKNSQRKSVEITQSEFSKESQGVSVSTSGRVAPPPPLPTLGLGVTSGSSSSSSGVSSTSRSTPSSSTGASSLSEPASTSLTTDLTREQQNQYQHSTNQSMFTDAKSLSSESNVPYSFAGVLSSSPSSQHNSPIRSDNNLTSSSSTGSSSPASSSHTPQPHTHIRRSGVAGRNITHHVSHVQMRLPMPPPPLPQHHRAFAVQSPVPPAGLGPHIPINPLAVFAPTAMPPTSGHVQSSSGAHTIPGSNNTSNNLSSFIGITSFGLPPGPSTPDFTAAAATVRWAASSHASLAPLAVPSPEHELTDPLRGVNVSVSAQAVESVRQLNTGKKRQDTEQQDDLSRSSIIGSSSSSRRWSRELPSNRGEAYWEELRHDENADLSSQNVSSTPVIPEEERQQITIPHTPLETIQASPLGSPNREETSRLQAERTERILRESVPAASAPLEGSNRSKQENTSGDYDYFSLGNPSLPLRHSRTATSPYQQGSVPTSPNLHVRERHAQNPMLEVGSASTPLSSRSLPDEDPSYRAEQTFRPRASSQDITSLAPEPGTVWSWAPQQEQQQQLMEHFQNPESSFSSNSFLSSPLSGGSLSLPNTPFRKGVLNRQSSSPLPAPHGKADERPPITQVQSPVSVQGSGFSRTGNAGVAAGKTISGSGSMRGLHSVSVDEMSFYENEYLIAPFPYDEEERRRALYKFNILHTAPDPNFDRIAYLAKLVFSTKIVTVSLIDEHEEWYKSESGLGRSYTTRSESLGAHSILQRTDEPIVILNAANDWRFRRHPMVVDSPFVKFCAAAPLRTQEGFSIGTLCVMDDQIRTEFSPRQRHTLKEFAAIAMREMELWRDKIQLRIRDRIQDSMEQFTRECLEIDNEAENSGTLLGTSSMEKVYDRAARLVKKTLDVEGAVVMDVSHFDVLETMNSEGAVSLVLHNGDVMGLPTTHIVPADEYSMFSDFFKKFPEGKVAEGIVPQCFRTLLPTRIQHALIVPIFNIDKRPFALLCAYNTASHSKSFLEGHELSYLRAIGVIILSAVLKRRMILADKSKSLFISNISHELRTPLHGILAAAELLADTVLDHNQAAFLQTVQACGTSLVETVNHVLDFTKLSGNSKAGGVENVINPNKTNLVQLVEEAVEGSWIGYRARLTATGNSEIGSVYSPPKQELVASAHQNMQTVETVIDIAFEQHGWQLTCEKGGIRRVLMNLIGNSLKFTTNGYVHIALRQLPGQEMRSSKVRIELVVEDTGKGISKDFLKNQLFQPFSQENPLQTGTGLGLAIVNSIVRSESIDGQVDVISTEGVGTEIRITFDAGLPDQETFSISERDLGTSSLLGIPRTVWLQSFNPESRGEMLLKVVLITYLEDWWGFEILSEDANPADIVIVNDVIGPIDEAVREKDTRQIFILLSSSRGSPTLTASVNAFERMGGFCRIIYKPVGPSRLRQELKACVHVLNMREAPRQSPPDLEKSEATDSSFALPPSMSLGKIMGSSESLSRRRSEETGTRHIRPATLTRANTLHPVMRKIPRQDIEVPQQVYPSSPGDTTIMVGAGGALLKSSVGTYDTEGRTRILVVEDNKILRDLLVRWLMNKGFDFDGATDGQEGVNKFEQEGRFDVVLLDLSMPNLDGIAATYKIREIEAARKRHFEQNPNSTDYVPHTAKILALTGMSSLEDKRRAFEAGVDGFMVKPVAFKTLDEMFRQLGISQ